MPRTDPKIILERWHEAALKSPPEEQRVCGILMASAALDIGPSAYEPPADLPVAAAEAFSEYLAKFRETPQQTTFDL